MDPGLVVGPVAFQEELAQPHVSFVPQAAARISLDHALPDLDRLLEFSGLEPRVTGLDQLLGRPILNQRASLSALLPLARLLGSVLRSGFTDDQRQQKTERNSDSQQTSHGEIPCAAKRVREVDSADQPTRECFILTSRATLFKPKGECRWVRGC